MNSKIYRQVLKSSTLAMVTILLSAAGLTKAGASPILPSISGISQTSAAPGTSITISGSNFNTTAANNIVFFGATKASVTAATGSSLTVTVPVGATYAPISVTNTASALTAYTPYAFMPVFSSTGYLPHTINFPAKADLTTSSSPVGVAMGDLDGDGKTDMVTVNQSNTISIFRNVSSSGTLTAGSFATKVDITCGGGPSAVIITDLDGDGKPEIVTCNSGAGTLSVFHNSSSSGSLTSASFTKTDLTTGSNPFSIAAGDIDKDGKPELIVSNASESTVSYFINTSTSGTISFATRANISTNIAPGTVGISDIDGDGLVDIIVNSQATANLSVYRNTTTGGTIAFAGKLDFTTQNAGRGMTIGDLDGDGKSEILTSSFNQSISVFRNTSTSGSLTFATRVDIAAGNTINALSLGDMDGDGKVDIAALAQSANLALVYQNIATTGSITAASFVRKDYTTGNSPTFVTIGDVDNDSRTDMMVVCQSANALAVYRGVPLILPTTISNISPLTGIPGSTVTITGTNFSTTAANNVVYFGSTKATVTTATATSLTVTVPAGAKCTAVTVNNKDIGTQTSSAQVFIPTYNNAGLSESVDFGPQADFAAPGGNYGVTYADFDGDGKTDMAIITGSTTSVYRNTSTSGSIDAGSFAAKADYSVANVSNNIWAADVDGDGKLDLLVPQSTVATISVLRNTSTTGSISFAARVDIATGVPAQQIAIGDLDGDGKPDIAGASSSYTALLILFNLSTPGVIAFSAKQEVVTGFSPKGVALADWDGDGITDIVTSKNDLALVILNHSYPGAAIFNTPVSIAGGVSVRDIVTCDIDGDGKQDAIIGNTFGTIVFVHNTSTPGAISFERCDFTIADPWGIAVGDLDGNGKPDVVLTNYYQNSISVMRNIGTPGSISGSTFDRIDIPLTFSPYGAAIADVDGDGKPDIALANGAAAKVTLFRNTPFPAIPVITSINTMSAAPGTSVTIKGRSFSPTAANDIVYFGATRATVTAAGYRSLTVTVPAGATYAPISVTNTDLDLTGYSSRFFQPIFNNSTYMTDSIRFTRAEITAGTDPNAVITGDIDGDGKPDIVVVNGTGSSISVFRNTSTPGSLNSSSFASNVDFAVPSSPSGVALGDLNGDGKYDIVVTSSSTNQVSVFKNIATAGSITTASLATRVDYTTGSSPRGVAITDMDADGKPDIIVANFTSGTVSVFKNNNDGSGTINGSTFGTRTDITGTTSAWKLKIADFDGNGTPDICVVKRQVAANGFNVILNNCTVGIINTGSFAAPVFTAVSCYADGIAVGDIDQDGKMDVAINGSCTSVTAFRNTSSGAGNISFTQAAAAVGQQTNSMDISDLNGDGKPEIVNGTNYNPPGTGIIVLRNTAGTGSFGSSTFAPYELSPGMSMPGGVIIDDMDGDGLPDVIATDNETNKISLYRNSTKHVLTPITGSLSVCTDLSTQLANITPDGIWTSSDESIAYVSASGEVYGMTAGTAIITYTMTDGAATAVVTVNERPEMGATSNVTVCKGTSVTITFTSSVPGSTYSWTNDNTTFGLGSSGTGNIGPFTAYAFTAEAQHSNIRVRATANGCTGYNASFSINMNPIPGIYGTQDDITVCSGAQVDAIYLFTSVIGADYNWTNDQPSIGIEASGTGGGYIHSFTASNTGSSTVSALFNVQPVYTEGGVSCYGTPVNWHVNVLPQPTPTTNTTSICAGTSTPLTATGSTSYTWIPYTSLSANTGATVTANPTATITYSVTGRSSASCSLTYITVSVNPNPAVSAGTISPVSCNGAGDGSASVTASGGTGTLSYDWTPGTPTGDGTSAITGLIPATYTCTVTDSKGCSGRASAAITQPTAITCSISSVTNATCNGGSNGSATVTASGGTGVITYSWAPVGGTAATATGLPAGNYTCTATDHNGCAKTATVTITEPSVVSINTTTSNSPVCSGFNLSFSGTASGGTGSISYTWSGPGGFTATGANPSLSNATTAATGAYTITATDANGCTASGTTAATVNPLPANISGTADVCLGLTTTLSNTTTGGAWSSSNDALATAGTDGVVTGNSPCTVNITYTLPTGCTRMVTVTVNGFPAAITGFGAICSGNNATLTDATAGGTWSSSNSAVASINAATGIVTSGSVAGSVTITYTSNKGCAVTTPEINPLADITGSNGTCIGLTTTLASATPGGTWSSSNTAIATVGSATGAVLAVAGGAATITYGAAGCFRTQDMTMSTTPAAITGPSEVCVGATITVADASLGGTWSYTNHTVLMGPLPSGVIIGQVAGVSAITYALSATCYITTDVTVNPLPSVITGTFKACPGTITTLACTATGGTWTTSNTSIAVADAASGVVTGIDAGVVTVSYTLATGCYRTQTVTINPLPSAITGTLVTCVGGSTALGNATAGGLSWSSSNTSVATVNATSGLATGIASGLTTITYTLATGCYVGATLTVSALPAAITGTLKVCSGQTTSLATTSTGGIWSVNNSSIAAINASGVVTGVATGNTAISYTTGGCTRSAVVTVSPVPAAITGATTICEGSTGTLIDAGGGVWTSDNTAIATILSANGVATATGIGTTNVTYTVSSGCFAATVLTIAPLPAAIGGSAAICLGVPATLSNSSSGGSWASSNTSIAPVSAAGVVTGFATGNAYITYTLPTGCYTTLRATANPLPSAIGGTTSVYAGATTTLTDATSGGTWTSGNTSFATADMATGVITGVASGTAKITYTLPSGCISTTTVIINAAPPGGITGAPNVCTGIPTTLANSTPGGTWTSSNPTVATIGLSTGVLIGNVTGTATITYTTAPGVYTTLIATVNNSPAVISGSLSLCPGTVNTLSNATTGGNSWVSSDPSVATIGVLSGVVTGLSVGTTAITYSLNTGCTAATILTVNPLPAAITGVLKACIGTTTTLADAVPTGAWTSGNTGVAGIGMATGVVTGMASGTAKITYTLPTGCMTSVIATINPLPAAISGTLITCTGTTTTLTNTGGGSWSVDNPAVATLISGGITSGVAPGTANVSFTTTAGCSTTAVVTVSPLPAASTGPATVCIGSTITLSNALTGGTWTSSNPGIATVGSATGIVSPLSSTGSVNITYSISSAGCRTVKAVAVNAIPTAITGTMTLCPGAATTLSSSAGGTWTSSNTAIATIGSISTVSGRVAGVATSGGNTTISYTNAAGCVRTAVVTVNPGPVGGTITSTGGFTINTTTPPTSVTLSSTGTPGGAWSSSAPAKATVGSATGVVSAVAAGTTNITYTVTSGGCTASATQIITVVAARAAATDAQVQTATNITIFPNPTQGTITLNAADAGTFTVCGIDGKEVGIYTVTAGSTQISLPSSIAPGIYICRYLGSNGNTATVRIVYEH